MEWIETFAFGSRIGPISEGNCFYDGIQTTDGEFALAGATTRSSGTYGEDGWLVKTTLTANEPTACGDVQWERTYGGSKYDVVHSVIQTMDGGYALAGFTQTSEKDVYCEEFWLVKTDAAGNEQWTQTYAGSEVEDTAFSIIQTVDGGFALTGSINGSEWTKASAWLVKTDANGIPQWNQTYGGHEWDWAEAIIQTADGGFALTGWTRSYGAGEADFWLVKTDARGAMEWEQTYGGTGDDFAFAVIETTDGGFALAGSLMVPQNHGYFDAWLVKTYPNGTVQWNQTYGGSGADNVYAIIETADGGYAIAGDTNSYGVDRHNFWLVKIDINGEAQWNQTYGGSNYDTAYAVIETPDGGFTLIGYTRSFGAGGFNGWLVKTDDYGDVEWTQTYGSSADDYVHSGIQTADGGFVLAGWTESFGTGSRDGWLVKTIPLDTDGDGLPDGYEIEHGLDLTVIDSGEDPDQ